MSIIRSAQASVYRRCFDMLMRGKHGGPIDFPNLMAIVADFGLMPVEAAEEMSSNNAVTRVLADLLGLPAPGPTPGDFAPAL